MCVAGLCRLTGQTLSIQTFDDNCEATIHNGSESGRANIGASVFIIDVFIWKWF